jgi:hypothetical protein
LAGITKGIRVHGQYDSSRGSKVAPALGKSKALARGLGALQVFIGLGAVGGGLGLVLEPSGGNLGIPLETLENSPFSTYLVPGIVLIIVNGLGSLVGAVASFKRHLCAGEIAMALGVFLVAWIALQVYWFAAVHWLHVMYFVIGLLEFVLGWSLRAGLRSASGPDE